MIVSVRRFACLIVAAGLGATAAGEDGPHTAEMTAADGSSRPVDGQAAVFFEARIRPIFAEHCQTCHGSKKQEAGLRLDSSAGLLKGTDAGPIVVPGQPEESPLIEAIRHAGSVKMPPDAKLPDSAIADLTRWVTMGAPWPATETAVTGAKGKGDDLAGRHWAFRPIHTPAIPAVADRAWPRTSVDAFILARLEAKGLKPSPEADRRTLIRRATFDLIGLPPTPEEVDSFEADRAPDAYGRLIERLLASPHYGERWARHWLDVARYSDTRGYVFFQDAEFHWAYTYRDYVIHSLNANLPFDSFIVEQLAADRLARGEDRSHLPALGFLTLGGRFMNNFHDVIDDRIDVVSRGLLGLTITCGRCHDHKYDPISSRDYYALYGVFATAQDPTIPPEFAPPPRTEAYAKFAAELKAREARLAAFVLTKHRELVTAARTRAADYLVAAQQALEQPNTEEFMLIADGSDLNPKMLDRWRAYLARTRKGHDPVFAPWHALAALPAGQFAGRAAGICARFRDILDPARPINPLIAQALADHPPRSLAEAAKTYGDLLNEVERGERRVPTGAAAAIEQVRRVFHGPDAPPDVPMAPFGDLALLPDRPSQAKFQELRNAVQEWLVKGPGAPPRAIALEDASPPYEPRVFLRGNPNNLGEPVARRLPDLLKEIDPRPFRDGGRLGLARAIVDSRNPLTARVLVNRIWMHHLATPLVSTPGDFGLRSDPPTHPELLDHLADGFIASGWSLKDLHRRIMLSSTYRQANDTRIEADSLDPGNSLYARMNRRRLDFEATRDALLAVAGRLETSIGGPSFANPADLKARRRTLYASIDRLNLPGLYRTFDFPDPNATSPRRDQTTVPPQALFLMNHPFVRSMAEAMANRPDVIAARDTDARVDRLYRIAYGRPPSDAEASLARTFLGDRPIPWVPFAQALLMGNEFVFVD